jgi:hypothetical protein
LKTPAIIFSLLFLLSLAPTNQTTIKISKLGNFSNNDKVRIERIINNLNKVINTDEFKQSVINHKSSGLIKFEENNNETNTQILDKILSGQETLDQKNDYEWSLNLNLKWLFSRSTLAYTEFKKPEIYINSRYYSRESDSEIAGTICHEYMHKVGYTHSKEYSIKRINTIPYAVGEICTYLYVNIISLEKQENSKCGLSCSVNEFINKYFQ